MSVQNENTAGGDSVVLERPAAGGVYASLFEKINLNPVSELSALDIWQDAQAMSDATADERLTAGMQVFLECLTKSGSHVEKLDKHLIDHHIAELDHQISRQLDAVMHHEDFQAVESLWCGLKSLVDKTDFRQNVKVELLDLSKDDLRQDFEDSPEIIQSGLYKHTYIDEYDTPGGEPIAALISAYEFDASAQDVALLRNISKVSAAAHMPFIGSAGPKCFLKSSMEEVAAIKDIGNYFDRAEYIKWKSFRETDDSRYIGLVMPRVVETQLTIDGQKLHYFNQMADWQSFRWPGETYKPGTMLTWTSTSAGARLFGDYNGTWGFIRWLEQGKRRQLDRSQWMMSYTAPDGRTLQWVLRSQLGNGPLALLALRNFSLPDKIFSVDASATAQALTGKENVAMDEME